MSQASGGPRLTKRELERERAAIAAAAAAAAAAREEECGAAVGGPPPAPAPPQPAVSLGTDNEQANNVMHHTSMPFLPPSPYGDSQPSDLQPPPPMGQPKGTFNSVYPYDQVPSSDELQFFSDIGGLSELPMGADMSGLPQTDTRRLDGGDLLQKRHADEAFLSPGLPSAAPMGMGLPAGFDTDLDSKSKKKRVHSSMAPSTPLPAPTPSNASVASNASGGGDKGSKGLRHFSLRVCKKVEEKGRTNYNEVADELVREVLQPKVDPLTGLPEQQYDEKNIRRRVYDALNVLMAMDIISKEKKEIRWKGLPSNAQHDIEVLQRDKRRLEQTLAKRREVLQELIMQRIAYKRLIKRNTERQALEASGRAGGDGLSESRVPLPFIIINTSSDTIVQCEMTEDRSDVFFNLNGPFSISDDIEILKRLGLRRATQVEVTEYVPHQLFRYVPPQVWSGDGEQAMAPPLPLDGIYALASVSSSSTYMDNYGMQVHDGFNPAMMLPSGTMTSV